jgi:hypothetical protein
MANKTYYVTYNKGLKTEFTLKVDGDYSPPERAVYYPVDNAHEGSDGSFEIEKIELTSGSVNDLVFEEISIDALMEKCYEQMDDEESWGDDRDYDED